MHSTMTVKQLQEVAKNLGLHGYTKLKKEALETLVNEKTAKTAKVETVVQPTSKEHYIANLQPGTLIAFKVRERAISGKVIQCGSRILVETKNGNRFSIVREEILWVKTGLRWPKYIYNLLKGGSTDVGEGSKTASC